MRRGSLVGGSSLMSSAWRATGVAFPVASVRVAVMWSVLSAWVDADDEPRTNTVATTNARRIEPSSAAGEPKSTGSDDLYFFSVTLWTRQLLISPMSRSFSERQSIELATPNSFDNLPAEPKCPMTLPSNCTL
jgi:hypothetical protein